MADAGNPLHVLVSLDEAAQSGGGTNCLVQVQYWSSSFLHKMSSVQILS